MTVHFLSTRCTVQCTSIVGSMTNHFLKLESEMTDDQ